MKVYYRAAIVTVFIFLTGIMFGIWIDNYRISSVRRTLSEIDVNWNDARLLNLYFEKLGEENCRLALQENLIFNGKIYQEGLEIEKAIESNRFTPELKEDKRRYVLLQTQFWLNSQELKKKCNFDYKNVVHFYLQNREGQSDIDHKIQSSVLLSLKERCGNKIMLIPLATDLNLTIIDVITKQYNVTDDIAILIDEKYVLQGLTALEELGKVVGC